ncbi:MAG TPA: hypothetical protein EYG78_03765 [Sulfurovum sp.]|nr:hypothetical protein [Sulfurovum sp.]
MIKFVVLFVLSTLLIFAGEKVVLPAYAAISALIVVLALFFWGIYKAVKTQRLVYALALLPFTLLLFWMFFI